MCFADNLIMLCNGDITSVETLKKTLDKFSTVSGLYPNLGKYTMFCGSLDNDTKSDISNIFPFKEGMLLVRYLGVLLVTKKIGVADCKQLMDRGLCIENPIHRIKYFLSVVDHIQADRATRDDSRLHFFHFTLKGKAKEWLDKIPPGIITSWEQIVSNSLNKDERWDRIEELIQYQDDSWDDPFVAEPTPNDRLNKAHQHLSFFTSSTSGKTLKNPYLICDIYGRAHEDDECDQVESREQACLSGGDIYDDPYLLKFYQNNDIPQWGNLIRKREEEEGPDWVVRSKFEDEVANFMMEKKYHLKGLVLKDLLSNKAKLENATSSITLSEECSATIQKNLPQKKRDPGSFTLPCLIGTMPVKNASVDLGASINLMPYSFFLKLGILELKPTKMSIQLADRSIKYPIGICENLLSKIEKFIFPVDFVILEMDEDVSVTIILGRPFLTTARAVIDVHDGKLSLRVGKERVTFNIGKSMKFSSTQDDCLYFADHTDEMVQEKLDDTLDPDRNWIDNEKGARLKRCKPSIST
ncbi:reverse transcriptase domain-containing protein [Tanacetum coccineum]